MEVADVISAPIEHSWSDCTGRAIVLPQYNHISEPPPPMQSDQLCPWAQIWRHVSLSTFLYGATLHPRISNIPSIPTDTCLFPEGIIWSEKPQAKYLQRLLAVFLHPCLIQIYSYALLAKHVSKHCPKILKMRIVPVLYKFIYTAEKSACCNMY